MVSDRQIKNLLNKGYSGSKIARMLHIRKQNALARIRAIKHIPVNPSKQKLNPYGQQGRPLDAESKAFADSLYKQGYTNKFITKLVNKKHPKTSQRAVKRYLKTQRGSEAESRSG